MPDLSHDQLRALDAMERFITAPSVPKPYFALQGLAGTGKTFMLSILAQRYPGLKICAFTGKAASVLRKRVGAPVTTMHSVVYNFKGLAKDDQGRMQPIFSPKGERLPRHVILIDEASMVGQRHAQDLLDTRARVIACGDPGQLPPVRDSQFFTRADTMLTQIHRQALGSPIIRQAHKVRNENRYEADGDGFRVVRAPEPEDLLNADIILCWRNRTRRRLNARKRSLLGLDGPLHPGEPIMCLKNDHRLGLLNGQVYELVERRDDGLVVSSDGDTIEIDAATVEGEDQKFDERRHDEDWMPFAAAYSSTVHKAQGSEYENVLLYDEALSDWRSFMYTGITRSVSRCTVVRYRS